jgi:hypothetical protein
VEDRLYDPFAAVQAEVGSGALREEDDDGVVEDVGAVAEVAVDAARFGDGTGEMVGKEGGDGGAEEADDGDRADAGGREEVDSVGTI